jgi:hypothetical protein
VDRLHVLAFAEEAIARPELLAAYARRFGAEDPVTLVLYAPAPGAGDVAGRLTAALGRVGLDADAGPDLMLLAPTGRTADVDARVAQTMAAVLTAREPHRAFAELPRFGVDALDDLGALVARWTALPAVA